MGAPTSGQAPGMLAILREFLGKYPREFTLLFVTLLVEGAVATTAVLAIVPVADFLMDPTLAHPSKVTAAIIGLLRSLDITPGFRVFGVIFVAANMVKGALDIVTKYSILRIKYAVTRGLFGEALTAFFRARWEFFTGADHGRMLNTLNRELNTIGDTLGHLATQLAQIVQLAIYLIVPLWLDARMTLTAVAISIVLTAPVLLLQKLAYRLGRRGTETGNSMIGVLSEVLGAARLILGFGRQTQARDRFLHAFDNHVNATLKGQTVNAAAAAFFQPIGILAAVAALGLALRAGTPVAEMAALLWSLLRALPLLGGLAATNVSIANFLPSYEQLVRLRSEAGRLQEVPGDKEFAGLMTGVELKSVDFTYPGRSETLRGVNLSIRKGRTTALVGESGTGKSTITDLVLGLQVPERGDVLLDGVPLSQWKQNSFRARVGYVPQDPLLFHASVRDNLLWSHPEATEADLWEACRLANAETFVRELPFGLDSIVGDRGVRLSGGQRQRIALARALLRKPELLILDEATSALDSESERLIQASVDALAGHATILVIAHRLSTIASADQVYVLRKGGVVEEGSYLELSKKPGGLLAGMIAVQRLLEPAGIGHS